jgi:hypothetical protein
MAPEIARLPHAALDFSRRAPVREEATENRKQAMTSLSENLSA